MSRTIQIRNVPDELHRTLKARAARAGLSLSDYLLRVAEREAETLTVEELAARVRSRGPYRGARPPSETLREIRNARWQTLAGLLAARRGAYALDDLGLLDVRRYPHTPLLRRAWDLRRNLTAPEALFVALAEALRAPLLTTDGRLARAPLPRGVTTLAP